MRRQEGVDQAADNAAKEIKPELLAYSLDSAITMIDKILSLPVTFKNIQEPEEIGLKDLGSLIAESKKSLSGFGARYGSKKFNETVNNIREINLSDYKPDGILLGILSYIGRPGQSLAYQPAVSKLEEDLGNLKGALSRLLLLVKDPSFEEALSDN